MAEMPKTENGLAIIESWADHSGYYPGKDHIRSAVDALRDVMGLIAEEEQESTTVDIAELVERIEGHFS